MATPSWRAGPIPPTNPWLATLGVSLLIPPPEGRSLQPPVAACPVLPLEITDDLRAPGAGSRAAGRPAPGYVPEVTDIEAAAARAMAATANPGEDVLDEDECEELEADVHPFGAGRRGVGPPLSVGRGSRRRELQDGGGLCSPGLWPPERRRHADAPIVEAFREDALADLRSLGMAAVKRAFATVAAVRGHRRFLLAWLMGCAGASRIASGHGVWSAARDPRTRNSR